MAPKTAEVRYAEVVAREFWEENCVLSQNRGCFSFRGEKQFRKRQKMESTKFGFRARGIFGCYEDNSRRVDPDASFSPGGNGLHKTSIMHEMK